ncbi:cytochrome C oxidase subunit IV family protein [Ilumatobacter coccineus]|uniref:Cytochrome C oxidase subunit IV n=1 Tax=Ilumatobacter coccineus (strain NBRC 103263 / KCTC 29153 / YM16-304) TaxID=1313172 RepID=A0A6C7EGC4_ILUCY|nr:cytochrome C oxidase subunit IV family protein [Ilumatobacter coccineus]BAN04179.1 hypothetical protein YM304_38650 [Ilumatobacter coccineus YM16-304]
MTTVEATDDHVAHDDEHAHDHPTDARYAIIALILAAITALEVAASYIDLGPIFLPALLGMMAVKFLIVVRMFMHLKFDNRVFSWMFYAGLLLALFVYLAALMTFRFFES